MPTLGPTRPAALRRTLPVAAALLFLAAAQPVGAAAPVTGVLTDTGQLLTSLTPPTPANGSYDLQFQLFNAANGGTQVGPTVSLSALPVVDGVFYAELNFGAVIGAPGLYLQTSYRVAGTTTYTVQSPRKLLPQSGYADYATEAGYAATAGTAVSAGSATTSNSTKALLTKALSAAVPTTGQVLTYNGSLWAPATPATGAAYTAGAGLTLSGSQFSVAVPLSLISADSVRTLSVFNTGSGDAGDFQSSTGTGLSTYSSSGYGLSATSGSAFGAGVFSGGGGYGVYGYNTGNADYGFLGGTDPKYSAPAGVFGSDAGHGNGILGISSGGAGSGVSGVSDGGLGVLGVSTSSDGMQGQTSESGHSGVSGVNNGSGHGVFGVSRSSGAYGFLGGTDPQYNAPAGVFGTNTTSSGNGVLGIGTSSTGVAGVSTSGDGVYASTGSGIGVSASASSTSGQALFANNTASGSLVTLGDQFGDGIYAYAASGKSAIRCDGALNVNGHASVHVLQITGGSDVAEPYAVGAAEGVSATPGLVVSIDPDHVGQMNVSHRAYDHAVAGILSGAGGVQPGLTLRQSGTVADGTLPVACSGRVWCYCDASAGGAISPGDLLTTSDTPGHAMKAGGGHELRGAILGKAMSSLRSGRGLVLVLVTLE